MDENWVNGLLADREPESQVLDFKAKPPSKDDNGIRSLLMDVAGFANARGGRIVYGIKEDGQGRADKLVDVVEGADALSLWMQTQLLGKVFPRVNGLVVQPVHTSQGTVIVVDVPSQYGGPYQASLAEWQRFTIRAGTRNVDMSYQQLFDSFALRSSVETRMDLWMKERTKHLASTSGGAIATIHVVPRSSFHGADRPDLSVLRNHIVRISGSILNNRFNYSGMVGSRSGMGSVAARPYIQFFRNGMVEVSWEVSSPKDYVSLMSMDTTIKLFDILPQVAIALGVAGVEGPGFVALSYVNTAAKTLYYEHSEGYFTDTQPIDENILVMGPVPYEALGTSVEELGPLVSDIMTDLFRAFGEDGCPYLNSEGVITHRRLGEMVAEYRRAWEAR